MKLTKQQKKICLSRHKVLGPKLRKRMSWAKSILIVVIMFGLLTGVFGTGPVKTKEAQAGFPVSVVVDIQRWIEYMMKEMQEVSVDQIRRMIIEEMTKMIQESLIGGQGMGGVNGSRFINDYSKFIYEASNKRTQEFIREYAQKFAPSYIDQTVVDNAAKMFDKDYSSIPDNCVNIDDISEDDPDKIEKLSKYIQYGCNNISLLGMLIEKGDTYNTLMQEQAKTEAITGAGFANKGEDWKLYQSGQTYAAMIWASIQANFDVQTNNQSSISSILSSFLSQMIRELMQKEFKR